MGIKSKENLLLDVLNQAECFLLEDNKVKAVAEFNQLTEYLLDLLSVCGEYNLFRKFLKHHLNSVANNGLFTQPNKIVNLITHHSVVSGSTVINFVPLHLKIQGVLHQAILNIEKGVTEKDGNDLIENVELFKEYMNENYFDSSTFVYDVFDVLRSSPVDLIPKANRELVLHQIRLAVVLASSPTIRKED